MDHIGLRNKIRGILMDAGGAVAQSLGRLIAALTLALALQHAHAIEFAGNVVAVADGDTLTVLVDRQRIKVRLSEIDAPEKKQPFGSRSKQSLSDLVFGKNVHVLSSSNDRYGRVLGRVYVGQQDVNAEQIRRGMAWVYDRYVTDRGLYRLQTEARNERRGSGSIRIRFHHGNGDTMSKLE